MVQGPLSRLFYNWGLWGMERWRNLFKVTYLWSGRAGICIWASWKAAKKHSQLKEEQGRETWKGLDWRTDDQWRGGNLAAALGCMGECRGWPMEMWWCERKCRGELGWWRLQPEAWGLECAWRLLALSACPSVYPLSLNPLNYSCFSFMVLVYL